jgi:hypothetical protein
MIGMDQKKTIAGEDTRIIHNFYANILKQVDFLDNIPDLFPTTKYLKRTGRLNTKQLQTAEFIEKEISASEVQKYRQELEKARPEEFAQLKAKFFIQNKQLVQSINELGLNIRDAPRRVENIMWSVLRNDRGYYWTRRVAELTDEQQARTGISDTAVSTLYNTSVHLSEVITNVAEYDFNHHIVYNKLSPSKAKEIDEQVQEYLQTPQSRKFTEKNSSQLPEYLKDYDSFTQLAIELVSDSGNKLNPIYQGRALKLSQGLTKRYKEENGDLSPQEYHTIKHIEDDISKAA